MMAEATNPYGILGPGTLDSLFRCLSQCSSGSILGYDKRQPGTRDSLGCFLGLRYGSTFQRPCPISVTGRSLLINSRCPHLQSTSTTNSVLYGILYGRTRIGVTPCHVDISHYLPLICAANKEYREGISTASGQRFPAI